MATSIVNYPEWKGGVLTYNGSTYTVTSTTYWKYLVTSQIQEYEGVTSASEPGTYDITFILKSGYTYENGSRSYSTSWTINKATQPVSFSLNSTSAFPGDIISGTWSGNIQESATPIYGTAKCTIDEEDYPTLYFNVGDVTGTGVVVAALSATTHYAYWTKTCEFTISEPPLTKPTFKTSQFQYTGGDIAPTTSDLNNYDSSCMSFSCEEHKAIGNYTATVSITSSTKKFPDGSTSTTLSWSIIKRDISGATIILDPSPTYNGREQEQTINAVSITGVSAQITYMVSGTTTATNVKTDGNYSITLTGTGENFTGTATTSWNIQKASATISGFSEKSISANVFDWWTRAGTTNFGTIVYSATGSAVTVDENTGKVTCDAAGTSTVYATVDGTTNYSGDSKSYTVSVSKIEAHFAKGCAPEIQSSWTYDGKTRYLFTSDGTPTPSYGTVYYCATTKTTDPLYRDFSSNRSDYVQTYAGGPWYLWTYIDVPTTDSQYTYSSLKKLGSVQVYAGTPTITTEPVVAERMHYTGAAQNLCSSEGAVTNGTMYYQYKTSTVTSDWSTSLPTATNVDTYTLYYKVIGDKNYSDIDATEFGEVEIYKAKAGWTTEPTFSSGKIYDGTTLKLVATTGTSNRGTPVFYATTTDSTTGPDISAYTSDITVAALNPTDAKKYYIWYRVKSKNTTIYDDGNAAKKTIEITKAPSTISYKNQNVSFYYDAENDAEKAYATATGAIGAVTYALETPSVAGFHLNTTNGTIVYEKGTAVNNYTITIVATDTGDDNHKSGSDNSTVSISVKAKQDVTLTPPVISANFYYDGTDHNLCTAGTVEHGTLYYKANTRTYEDTWSTVVPSAKYLDTYEIWYKVDADEGYNDIAATSLGTVQCLAGSVVINPYPVISSNFIYDGKSHNLCSAGTVTHGTMWYRVSTDSYTYDWITTVPTASNVDKYEVSYKVVADYGYTDVPITSLGTVSCLKGQAIWTSNPTYASNLVFNSSYQTLVTAAGTANFGYPAFALKTSSTETPISSDYASLDVTPIQAYNAGTYYVWQKVISTDPNRDDAPAKQVEVKIAKKPSPIKYNGQTIGYTYHPTADYTRALAKATNNAGIVTYSLQEGTPDIFWIDDKNNLVCKAGTPTSSSCVIYVVATDDGGSSGNYEPGSATSTTTVIIYKADSPITFEGSAIRTDFSYSVTDLSFTAASGSTGTVSYSIKEQKDSKSQEVNYFSIPTAAANKIQMAAATPIGYYTITIIASDPGDENYREGTAEATINVSVVKASCVFWAPTDPKKEYDGTNQFVGLIVQSPPVEKVKIDYTINGSASTPVINAGTYTVAYTISDTDGNFTPESGTYNLTVSKRYTKMRSTGGNMEFGDAVPTLSAWIDEETPLVQEGDLGELKPSNIITSESDANKDYTTTVTYTGNNNYNVEELFGAIHMNPYVITSRPKLINGKDEISTWVYNGTSKARDYYVAPTFKKDKYVDITNFLNYIDKVTADNYSILYQIPSTYFGNVKWSGTDSDTITLDWSITKCMSFSLSIYNPTSMSEHDAGTTDTLQYSHSIEFVDASQVSISSSNPSVVAIDASGNISYLSKGTADLTVAVVDNVNHVANSSTVRVVVKANDSIMYIYHNGEFVPAIPYIYTNGQWREARAILYSNGKWNPQ